MTEPTDCPCGNPRTHDPNTNLTCATAWWINLKREYAAATPQERAAAINLDILAMHDDPEPTPDRLAARYAHGYQEDAT